MHLPSFLFALTWAFALVQNVRSKVVFAHYMVGSVTADHVKIDIDQAQAAGIQGFSLNIADPSKDFVASTLAYMFAYAPTVGFHLHISMDIWASGDSAGGHPEIYDDLLAQYMHVSGYFTMNGLPYVTTFSDGGLTNTLWNSWRSNLGSSIYFCPDFDGTTGYTSGADGWWYYWGDSLDCVLSWEAAWPVRSGQTAGSASQGSIEIDLAVLDSAVERGKQYNMPLSALQYKNAYGTNIYRQGDLTLVKRMANIIGMTTKPDFVTVITWNDGPESHYVGNVWPEQNTDSDPARYVTAGTRWDHGGWRSLIKSFTTAYLNGGSSMLPSSTTAVEGAMWYRGVMQSSVCPSGSYPDGWEAGTDQVNWAIVVGTSLSNIVVHVTSGSVTTIYTAVGSGLHYGVAAKHPGQQLLEVYSGTTKIAVAQGGRCVSSLCPDGIFNMNDIVVGVVSPGSAPSQVVCEDPTCADVSRRYVPVPQPQSRRNVSLLVRQSEDFNYYSLNHAKIATDLMVGDLDGDGNRKPRQNCIFYVNQRDVDSEDPNYAKNRAVQFADIMNAAYPGSDYHTLYDVYDTAAAFSYTDNPMASAMSSGNLRPWFQDTSQAFAELCEGKVYLIVDAEPQEIWSESIWLTHEWPAIVASGLVTQVIEIRPEDVGTAVANNGNLRYIRNYPYRGGQPPGATPPRGDDTSEIASCVSIDPDASNEKFAGVVDVSGDIVPYVEGSCTMHVHQWYNPNAGGETIGGDPAWTGPYSVEITMYDSGPTNKIGYVARSNANDPNALHMVSKLEDELIVTPEESNDYIQFNLGSQSFASNDGSCTVGKWDRSIDRQMDCHFTCTWAGGDSSDRSEIGVYYS